MGKAAMPALHSPKTKFEIGKAIQITPLSDTYDVGFFATGETVPRAYYASQMLAKHGLTACVLSIHSLRPFDKEGVAQVAEKSKIVITVEEHSINGGLGSVVASFLMQAGIYRPMKIVGIPDEPTVTGSQLEIFNHYGISAQGLTETALKLIKKIE
jgi:transketolase